ncbi:MAG: GNAT family protein [Gammaproteobacteria bacterium]|nr:GNAT family protein [Gammaproteobacteria bacterium]
MIKIRRYEFKDAQARYEAIKESQGHLLPFIPWAKDMSLAQCEEWVRGVIKKWDEGGEYAFAIVGENDAYLGEIRLLGVTINTYERFANLAYWVKASAARRGIVTAAIKIIAPYAFEVLKLNRIQIMILPENKKSIGSAEKVGAKREGYLRNQWRFGDQLHDVILFSLTPKDLAEVAKDRQY